MVNKPKAIGTSAETAVVRTLRANGFPNAERRALRGSLDVGDVTGCPGLVWEVKGGQAAAQASDGQVAAWLAETERERVHADADYGILVIRRGGIGPGNAGRWWAVLTSRRLADLVYGISYDMEHPSFPVRMWLSDVCELLRHAGYGEDHAGCDDPRCTRRAGRCVGMHCARCGEPCSSQGHHCAAQPHGSAVPHGSAAPTETRTA